MADKKYLVITCDGGGIRGLITTLLLQDLGQTTLDNVALWSGTSTGSVIALGLAAGMSIDELVAIYLSPEFCSELFTPFQPKSLAHRDHHNKLAEFLEKLVGDQETEEGSGETDDKKLLGIDLESLLFPKYSAQARHDVMAKYMPEMTMEQLWTQRQKRGLVSTFFLNRDLPDGRRQWMPTTIHNLPNLNNSGQYTTSTVVDAAMASTAFPIFWRAHELKPGQLFADGGLFANNPSTLALTSLMGSGILEQEELTLNDVYMLSVGTGFNPASYPSQSRIPRTFPWGILGWLWPKASPNVGAMPLIDAISDSSSQVDAFQSAILLGRENYRRANIDLGQDVIAADACSSVGDMQKLTEKYLQTDEWKATKAWVEQNFT